MPHERIEHIDRTLGLLCHRIDVREVVQVDDTHARIVREWLQRGPVFPRLDRIGEMAGVRVRDTQAAVRAGIGRHRENQRLVCGHGAVGIDARARWVAQRGVGFREREGPCRPILVEIGRPERQQVLPLRIVEDPLLPALRRDVGDE
jgi:hypothetical protein